MLGGRHYYDFVPDLILLRHGRSEWNELNLFTGWHDVDLNAAGEIAPAEQVSVRPEINGLVELLPVDVGDRVKKDALLFRLDDKLLQQQRASNLTDIEKAKLNLAKAERDHKRAQQLLAEKLISQEVYDDTKTAHDLSKNALERTQKDMNLTDEQLADLESYTA